MSRNVVYALIAILIIAFVVILLASRRGTSTQGAIISPVPSQSISAAPTTKTPSISPTAKVSPTTSVSPTVQTTTSPTP